VWQLVLVKSNQVNIKAITRNLTVFRRRYIPSLYFHHFSFFHYIPFLFRCH